MHTFFLTFAVIMPRTKRARPERGETSNPVQRQPQQQHHRYPTVDFLTYHPEKAYSNFANRPIVTGRKVNLPSQYNPLLLGRLDTMGWLPLTNLPHKVYPRLVYLFSLHLTSAEEQVEPFSLTSYVKGKVITLNPYTFTQIIRVNTGDLQCYFQTETQLANIVDDLTEIYITICES